MSRAENKASRLLQIENLLLAHPEGLTQAEIARRTGVNRSTINRYLPDLPKHIYIDVLDGDKWKIDRTTDLINVRLNLHEALAVHLASRLLATRMDRQNLHAASALRKLSLALERWAPHISRHISQSADVMDDAAQRHDPVYLQALEKLTLAWAEQRKVRVWHRREAGGQIHEYIFSPYFIEPYAVGLATHVIGFREPPGALRTFKIERIERVEPLRDAYTIPSDFDPRQLLASAWGIWYTESEPVEVVLRFHPRVAPRVLETRWHRSQQVEEQADGGLLWRAKVAEPQEMLPWIRGWGADVEVAEPRELRSTLKKEAQRMQTLYGVGVSPTPPYQLLWAKTDQSNGKLHRLIYHLIDVGQVTSALWEHALDFDTKSKFTAWFQMDSEQTSRLLAFLASLHDLGKASPIFQLKYPPALDELRKVGFGFPTEIPIQPAPHGVISTWVLRSLLQSELGLSRLDAGLIASALGGHHGSWPTPVQLGPTALKSADKGDGAWDTARLELFRALKTVFVPPTSFRLPTDQQSANAMLTLFSGLTSVADWVGSMSEFFSYEMDSLPLETYSRRSAYRAEAALRELGWLGWQASGEQLTFQQMFPFVPNSVQETMIEIVNQVTLPVLLILEAPTGSGKTEAALYAADTWLQTRQGHGLYIAMPTQATSNQMHKRVKEFLQVRYPQQTLKVHLVHSAALLADEKKPASLQGIFDDDQNKTEGGVRAEAWFLQRRKRTLLARFGVGTVDQALMSVLQTRHFFVRLFGLGSKVVVFDEIHAYDTYMSELFQRLLAWLRQIGASVILLSATLPEDTRRQLTAAYIGKKDVDLPPAEYPRLTIASEGGVRSIPFAAPASRSVYLEWSPAEVQAIVDRLREALVEGGCAAVICNRIQRALEVYAAVRDAGLVSAEDLILFHARFPFQWRAEIEEQVMARFREGGEREGKSIVIATQVIEQSLDLDFDYMISDLAPLDLLIQRAGRLHRHNQNDPNRPSRLKVARLIVAAPDMVAGIPDFGRDVYVYDRAILLRTWLALAGRTVMNLPADTTPLIEAVYGGQLIISDERLRQAVARAEAEARKKEQEVIYRARQCLIARPDDEDLLFQNNVGLEEEDPNVHEAFRALTRLAEPGVSLICLHRVAGQIYLDPEGTGEPLDLNRRPEYALVCDLRRCAVSVQRREIVTHFTSKGIHPAWKEVAALRYHFPIVFDNGHCTLEGTPYTLVLSRETGLEIHKEEK